MNERSQKNWPIAWSSSLVFVAILALRTSTSFAADAGEANLNGVALPATLHGKWDFEGRVSNIWSVRIDRLLPDGRVDGNLTWWGVRCSVKGETITEGSWREGRLRLRAPTNNKHACGDILIDLGVGTTQLFEGTATNTMNTGTVKAWLEKP